MRVSTGDNISNMPRAPTYSHPVILYLARHSQCEGERACVIIVRFYNALPPPPPREQSDVFFVCVCVNGHASLTLLASDVRFFVGLVVMCFIERACVVLGSKRKLHMPYVKLYAHVSANSMCVRSCFFSRQVE